MTRPAAWLAEYDQRLASADEFLDGLIEIVRGLSSEDEFTAAQSLAIALKLTEHNKVAEIALVATLRLAKQGDPS